MMVFLLRKVELLWVLLKAIVNSEGCHGVVVLIEVGGGTGEVDGSDKLWWCRQGKRICCAEVLCGYIFYNRGEGNERLFFYGEAAKG
ncbi:hypothetical protein Peur_002673 [Populus x canadensis]